jgi:hypothetical protein
MRKYRWYYLLGMWFALIPLLTSCVAEFVNPIPPPKNLKPDPALLGEWEIAEGDEKVRLYIYPRLSGWMDIILLEMGSDHKINLEVYEGYSTQINQDKFLCLMVRETDLEKKEDKKEPSGYHIIHYKISDEGAFSFRMFDVEKVKEMVRKGELKGTITLGRTLVTSKANELVRQIQEKGAEAFIDTREDIKKSTFVRPKP